MNHEHNNHFDLKIEKLRKVSAITGVIGLILLAFIFIFDLSYPNILFSLLAALSLALIFLSAGMYIATWMMEIGLAFQRKQYLLVAFLILGVAIWIYLSISRNS